jgi:hypothetical protein
MEVYIKGSVCQALDHRTPIRPAVEGESTPRGDLGRRECNGIGEIGYSCAPEEGLRNLGFDPSPDPDHTPYRPSSLIGFQRVSQPTATPPPLNGTVIVKDLSEFVLWLET